MEAAVKVRGTPLECLLEIGEYEDAESVCRRVIAKLGLAGVDLTMVRLVVDGEVVAPRCRLGGGFTEIELVVEDYKERLAEMGISPTGEAMRVAAEGLEVEAVSLLHKVGVTFYKEMMNDAVSAAAPGDAERLGELLRVMTVDSEIPPSWYRGRGGKTAFHVCKTEHIRILSEVGVDVNEVDFDGMTPLHSVFGRPYLTFPDCVIELINVGADVNARDRHGSTPLGNACINGHLPSVELLVSRGARINCRDHLVGFTPLHLAASLGHPHIVAYLVSAGGDVNLRSTRNLHPYQTVLREFHVDKQLKERHRQTLQILRSELKIPRHMHACARLFDLICCCSNRPACVTLPPCTASKHGA